MKQDKDYQKSEVFLLVEDLLRARYEFYTKHIKENGSVAGCLKVNGEPLVIFSNIIRNKNNVYGSTQKFDDQFKGYNLLSEATKNCHIFTYAGSWRNEAYFVLGTQEFNLLGQKCIVTYQAPIRNEEHRVTKVTKVKFIKLKADVDNFSLAEKTDRKIIISEYANDFVLLKNEVLELKRNKHIKEWYIANPDKEVRV